MKKLFVFLSVIALFINGCSKNDDGTLDNNTAPAYQPIPGMGETEGELQGEDFTLPDGIVLDEEITGAYPFPDTVTAELGYGPYVIVYIRFKNNKSEDITFTLPAGLVIKALDNEDQNGIILQDQTVTVGHGKICIIQLNAYCTNASRHASSSNSKYAFGLVTNAPTMKYLLKLLKNKNLSQDEDEDSQTCVWILTDTGESSLDNDLWTSIQSYINNIPDK